MSVEREHRADGNIKRVYSSFIWLWCLLKQLLDNIADNFNIFFDILPDLCIIIAPQGSQRTPATCIAATTPELTVEILNSCFKF